jgi:hypothetical protein
MSQIKNLTKNKINWMTNAKKQLKKRSKQSNRRLKAPLVSMALFCYFRPHVDQV